MSSLSAANLILEGIKTYKGPRIVKVILKKNNKVNRLAFLDINISYMAVNHLENCDTGGRRDW